LIALPSLKVIPLLAILLVSGCTTKSRPSLGETVTITPGWSKLKQAGQRAIRDPNVWATLLTAVLLQIDDLDQEISDQLREDTPIFGSNQKASDASDDFRSMTEIAYVSTALLVPGPEGAGEWFSTKARLLGSEWVTVETAQLFASEIKDLSQRERPNARDNQSFPSGHVTVASTQAQMANLNVEFLPIDESSKQALYITFDSFSALTAWGRVEAGEHYPSDVLAGWALGHFISYFGRQFIGPDHQQMLIRPQMGDGLSGLELVFRF
jgi:membrane-associated phospholipid phosphatase